MKGAIGSEQDAPPVVVFKSSKNVDGGYYSFHLSSHEPYISASNWVHSFSIPRVKDQNVMIRIVWNSLLIDSKKELWLITLNKLGIKSSFRRRKSTL